MRWLAVAALIGIVCGAALSAPFRVRVSNKALSGLEWGAPFAAPPPGAAPAAPLALRLVDAGGVGIPADTARWGDGYSHATHAFEPLALDRAPWVDPSALARVRSDWTRYLDRMASYGNNAVVLDEFLQLIRFERVEGGTAVYGADDPLRARHLALRGAFATLLHDARAAGLAPYLKTDLPALTPELEAYLRKRTGGLDTADPEFWAVYAAGLDELFDALPELEGVVVRVGEAGPLFQAAGSRYRSYMGVRTTAELRRMLRSLLPVFERHHRTMILRSWSVGVGPLGHLHDDPAVYEAALGGIDSPALIVSTKFVAGDYFGFLPLNPTLRVGTQKRLVEFQARREFEGFGALPDYLGETHRRALLQLRAANPNIVGVQLWTQEGGPLRAGPLSLYTVAGFWRWTDANVYATSRLMRDPSADSRALAEEWARRAVADDPEVAARMADVLVLSREALEKAVYIRPYAARRVDLMGMQAPPILWIFEWDVIGGWSSVLAAVYRALEGDVQPAIDEGFEAVALTRAMRADLDALAPKLGATPEWAPMVRSLAYQESLYETLAWYRAAFLDYYRWLDRGGEPRWRADADRFLAAAADHRARFGGDLDFPAFDFGPAVHTVERAQAADGAIHAARILLAVVLGVLLLGAAHARRWVPDHGSTRWTRAIAVGSASPWRLVEDDRAAALDAWLLGAAVVAVVGLTVSLLFSVSAWEAVVGTSALLATYAVALRGSWRGSEHSGARHARHAPATVGPLLLAAIPALIAVAVRGPDFLLLRIWTDDAFRTVAFALGVTALLWTLASTHALGRRVGGRSSFATGSLLLAGGAALVVLGVMLPDLQGTLAALDDPLNLFPMRPAIIHGITEYAGLSRAVLWLPGVTGALLAVGGAALRGFGSARGAAGRRSSPAER